MKYILFDYDRAAFLPLTFTRPISDLRIGIDTIREKWEYYFDDISIKTADYLSEKFCLRTVKINVWINAQVIPNQSVVNEINSLKNNEVLIKNDLPIAFVAEDFRWDNLNKKSSVSEFIFIENVWDIFMRNGEIIKDDFDRITQKRKSAALNQWSKKIGDYPVFIEQGASVFDATFNCTNGPIYIGQNAIVMEGVMIRGPFAMGRDSELKMGSKVYSNTTLGPSCKVGGEVNNVVFQGYSNKAHDGFLGNSVIGQWCNIGADTNCSNLKNNYEEVKLWDYKSNKFRETGLQFCGLIMGDHSKSAINTMFNTGTVVGVSANIFGSGFPRNFIPSFSWGGAGGMITYKFEKAIEVASKVMQRRNIQLDETERNILWHVFEQTKVYRNEK